jgi:crossover junction endodeoxyribonuclease RuvC
MRVIGCDPGMSGAIAVLSPDGSLLSLHDMPVFAVVRRVGGKDRIRRHVNVHELGGLLQPYVGERAVIELVSAQPTDGAIQAFQFGFSAGALHGAVGALGMRLETVRPQEWKKHFGLPADKNAARQLATRRWPVFAEKFKRVADAGRAEAALIGLYAIETQSRAAA